jgi:UDP-N-acetylglucosamine:LPS N-acetylglucosamine transferase
MILSPSFYDAPRLSPQRRKEAREALGFDAGSPVGLLMFGGQGAAVMLDIARRLPNRQILAICGHNDKLAEKLRQLDRPATMFVEGFTSEVPHYMQLCDYFIGKPGPGALSEAIFMGLPAIVERNAWTLPQERYNPDWLRENGAGIVLPDFRRIARAVDELLDPAAYDRFRAATRRMTNRAVYEIPDILERIAQSIPLAPGP